MDPLHSPHHPTRECSYATQPRAQLCSRHHRNNYPAPLHYALDDHYTTSVDVHDYPSSESGIAADCDRTKSSMSTRRRRHRRRDDRSTLSGNEDDDEDDGDELSLGERCARDLDEILPARLKNVKINQYDQQQPATHWNRSQIVETMERYDPSQYCYAYYSPEKDLSIPSSSMRHHLSMPSSSKRNARQRATNRSVVNAKERNSRHAYVTRYGTEENIYEEITEGSKNRCQRHRCPRRRSVVSLDRSVVEEVRIVEHRHNRILGELNLSVEAMLMPESSDSEKNEGNDDVDELLRVGPTDELLSPASCIPPDVDSGFSGSSSGASYIGSLRCKQGTPSSTLTSASIPNTSLNLSIPPNGATFHNNSLTARSSSCEDRVKNTGFWNKKSWKKIPGFSSSNSINKAGLSGLLVKYTMSRKTSSPAASPLETKQPPEVLHCETCLSQRC